jgi:hypothetical protein
MQQRPLDLGEQQSKEGRCGDELRERLGQETRRTRIETDPWTGQGFPTTTFSCVEQARRLAGWLLPLPDCVDTGACCLSNINYQGSMGRQRRNECYQSVAQALEALEERDLFKSGKEAGRRHDMGGYELLQNIKSLAFSGCLNFFLMDFLRDVCLTA